MLQQPRSPRPEAQRGDTGGPQLLGNHGAIRGKAAGKEKSDLRDTTRLGEPPNSWSASKGWVLSPQLSWNQDPQPPYPGRWRAPSTSTLRDACGTAAHTGTTGDPGHGTKDHLLPLRGRHPLPVVAGHGLVWGSPRSSPPPWKHMPYVSSCSPSRPPGHMVGRVRAGMLEHSSVQQVTRGGCSHHTEPGHLLLQGNTHQAPSAASWLWQGRDGPGTASSILQVSATVKRKLLYLSG